MKRSKVGLVGCGNISVEYLRNLKHSEIVEVAACTDIDPEKARAAAQLADIPRICTLEELLAMPEIEIVLNLTNPTSHFKVNRFALNAGKHVYCEKPLATSYDDAKQTMEIAKNKGLQVGCAPDTILGAGLQTCKKVIQDGWIGRPLAATANFTHPGHELWHPAPQFLYKQGAGPVWDMGPYYFAALIMLLGPIEQVGCFSHTGRSQRKILSQPCAGEDIDVEVPTHYSGILKFDSGVIANLNLSWEVWSSKLPHMEIHGTEGSLFATNPVEFGGIVKLLRKDTAINKVKRLSFPDNLIYTTGGEMLEDFRELPMPFPHQEDNLRGIGLEEMASAIRAGQPFTVNGNFALHVVESLLAMDKSVEENRIVSIKSPV